MKRILQIVMAFCFLSNTAFAQSTPNIQGDIIVQLTPEADVQTLVDRLQTVNGVATELNLDRLLSDHMRAYLLHFDYGNINQEAMIAAVWAADEVKIAQFNHVSSYRVVPNDPQLAQQWQWINGNDHDVDADEAWDTTTGGGTADGTEIVVAVIEGANRNHPDLVANTWTNAFEIPGNGIDDDNNGYTDDIGGWNPQGNNGNIPSANHGTAVGGMIGAVGDNNLGICGINWDVKIMNVTVGGLSDANVIASYTYPLVQRMRFNETNGDEGAFVVATNASWGIDFGDPNDAPLWCAFYDTLGVHGILNCGATSNQNLNIDQTGDLPTACPSDYMVAVTATNNQDVRTFSGYGQTTIDLGAPGDNIYSLTTNGYGSTSGTSFASPLTAGVIALMYSIPCNELKEQAIADPQGTADVVRTKLFEGVDPVSNLTTETVTGGRVNANNSVLSLLTECGPCPKPYGIEVSNFTDSSAMVQWGAGDATIEALIRIRDNEMSPWDTLTATSSPFTIPGLEGCMNYEIQLAANCDTIQTEFTESIFFDSEGCCTAPQNLNSSITSDDMATVTWDAVYAAENYIVEISTNGEPAVTSTVEETSFDLGIEPCNSYSIQIITGCGPDSISVGSQLLTFDSECICTDPTNPDTMNVNYNDVTLMWDEGNENSEGYVLRYRKLSEVTWTFVETPTNEYLLTELDSCQNYRFQVKSICATTESAYTPNFNFKTACFVAPPSSVYESAEEIASILVTPNPFSDQFAIALELTASTDVAIEVFSADGRLIHTAQQKSLQAGAHSLAVSESANWGQGIYIVSIKTDTGVKTSRVIKQ